MLHKFCLSCAPYCLEVSCNQSDLYQQFLVHYDRFIGEGKVEFRVRIEANPGAYKNLGKINFTDQMVLFNEPGFRGEINLENLTGKLEISLRDPFYGADYFLRVAAACLHYTKGGLMIHGAGIKRGQDGYLFVGKSGVGKTTVARHSSGATVLNDDLVFLQPQNNGWMMYASPFYNSTQITPQPDQALLKGIFFLVQDKIVYLEDMNQSSAVAALLANVPVLSSNPLMLNGIFIRCVNIIQNTFYANLHFLPDDSFWKVIH